MILAAPMGLSVWVGGRSVNFSMRVGQSHDVLGNGISDRSVQLARIVPLDRCDGVGGALGSLWLYSANRPTMAVSGLCGVCYAIPLLPVCPRARAHLGSMALGLADMGSGCCATDVSDRRGDDGRAYRNGGD